VSPASIAFPEAIPSLSDGTVTLRAPRRDEVRAAGDGSEIARWLTRLEPGADPRNGQEPAGGRAGGQLYPFAIEIEGRLAGGVSLRARSSGVAEIGYALAAEYRGRGLMSRALRLTLRWGFEHGGIEVVHWKSPVGDWASRRAAWAVGFRVLDGVVPGLLEHQGSSADGWLATLRRGDDLEPAHAWLTPEPITGRSVALRAHHERDLPRLIEACRDPETQRWLSDLPADYSEIEARRHLHQILCEQASGKGLYWVAADPDDRLLAELGLFRRSPSDTYAEIGYWTHPDARGRGLTTESVRLAVRHALLPVDDGGLWLSSVLLRAAEGNLASQRVAEKAGFTRTGRDRNAHRRRDGSRGDHFRFDLLAAELPSVR
jgi:RimJ/RimL family protein N-acetyltransferase